MGVMEQRRSIIAQEPHLYTATGNPASFSTDMVGRLAEVKCAFSPVQSGSGDPSPSNVRPITGWTGINVYHGADQTEYTTIPVTFPAVGVNQFNGHWSQGNIQEGAFVPSTTAICTGFIDVKPSTSYYGYTTRTANVFVFEYTEDGTYANKVNNIASTHTFTTGATTKKVRIADRNGGTGSVETGINYPATSTTYEPYTNTVYGGYVDIVNGQLVAEYGIANLKASAIQGTWDSETGKGAYWYTSSIQALQAVNDGVFCNKLKTQSSVSVNDTSNCITWYTNGIIRWVELGAMEMTKDEYNAYLDENPLIVTYKLATPIVYPLTPQQIAALKGDNVIWSDANGSIEVKYWKHG